MAVLCVVQDCPVYNDIGPYIYVLGVDAKATIDSIFRGQAAEKILNSRHPPKHSQRQLSQATAAERAAWGILGTPDAPGHSTHEKYSDGVAYPNVPSGHALEWWQQGFDVNAADCDRVIAVARSHGWSVWRPYDSTAELHHLNFRSPPQPGPQIIDRIYRLRRTLPRG